MKIVDYLFSELLMSGPVSGLSMLGRVGSVDSRAEPRPPATVLARLRADSFARW